MKFTHKIMLMPLLTAMAFIVFFVIYNFQATENTKLSDRIEQVSFPAVRIGHDLETSTMKIRHVLQNSISLQDPDMIVDADEIHKTALALLDSLHHLLPEYATLTYGTRSALESYYTLARSLTMQMIATELTEEVYPIVVEMNARYDVLTKSLRESGVRLERSMEQSFANARETRKRASIQMHLASAVALGLILLISLGLAASVLRPLRRITAVTESIASGKLDAELEYKSNDELGRLANSFRRMQQNLILDITQRENVEAALRESEGRYRGIFEHATAGIVRSSVDGKVIAANPALLEMMGYDTEKQAKEEITDIGRQVYARPEDRERVMQKLAERGQLTEEMHFQRKDKSQFCVQMSLWAVRDPERKITAIEGIILDIDERKKVERALKQAMKDVELSNTKLAQANSELTSANAELRATQARLVHSEKMASMGRFVAGIAHEFNNPVSAVQSSSLNIKSCVGKLKEELSKPPMEIDRKRVEVLLGVLVGSDEVILEGSHRVTSIVNKLRSFIRLDQAERQLFDVHESIRDTLAVFEHERKPGVFVVTEFGDVPKVLCYPARLNQMILQLLSNANKAIRDSGEIKIHTTSHGNFVRIRIEDNGIGIKESHLGRIFEPGFTTWTVGVGVGLGLSIAYQIAEEHGGEIHVDSTSGQGTTFTIDLPIKRA
jgi:PAS domain S-box-containing protein